MVRWAIQSLRQVKHGMFITRQRLARAKRDAQDAWWRVSPLSARFVFDPTNYRVRRPGLLLPNSAPFFVNFLDFRQPASPAGWLPEAAPSVLYTLWTGDNPMGERREESLRTIRERSGNVAVIHVSAEEARTLERSDWPFHRSYDALSPTHRSDYLRCYLMHHYGGAYCDIKPVIGDWAKVIADLNASPTAWASGPPERSAYNASAAPGPMGLDQMRNYWRMPNPAAFAFKPGTPWTREWLEEVERRLDYYAGPLERDPWVEGEENRDYPIVWNSLLGQVLAALSLKYLDRMNVVGAIKVMDYENHR